MESQSTYQTKLATMVDHHHHRPNPILPKNSKKRRKALSFLSILSGAIGFIAWCKFFIVHTIIQSSFHQIYHKNIYDSFQPRSRRLRNYDNEEEGGGGRGGEMLRSPPSFSSVQVKPDAFGACLLIMDDNHWLIEWLAYHYYVGMTDLIVAVDPESRTSPESILERWRDKINIEVWNDDKVGVPKYKMESARIVLRHRLRQTYFYQTCMKHYKNHGIKWVMLIDTDEFIYPYDEELEHGVVRRILQQHEKEKEEECLNVPRYQFGVRDYKKKPLTAPAGLNISMHNVATERFQYREKKPMELDNQTNSAGKNLVNVQQIMSFPDTPPISVHQVLPECSPTYNVREDPVLLINHYTGSKEQFKFRRDPRGLMFRIKYEDRIRYAKVHDPKMTSWVQRFVDFVGNEEAMHLLQDVGEPQKAGKRPFYDCGCPNTCDLAAMDKESPIKKDSISCRSRVKFLLEHYKIGIEAACIKAAEESDPACGYECHPKFCTAQEASVEESLVEAKLLPDSYITPNQSRVTGYYLQGKTQYHIKPFDDFQTYEDIENELPERVLYSDQNTWILPNKLLHPTRNHDSVIVEYSGKQLLVNVLGRHNRYVEVMDLLTGEQWDHLSTGSDPQGFPLNDLNHICTVLVDSIENDGKKELWMPCGFKGDRVNRETSINYARILDLETLELRVGPMLPYSGGACVAQPLEIIPNEPPMICTFGGTIDRHDSGKFLPYSTCYDRLRGKWWFPFGRLPFGLDHGSTAFVPPNTCRPDDPSRIMILNFRTESYGTQRSEILAYDLPSGGWNVQDLEKMSMEDPGNWYIYTNVSYTGPEDIANCPRDASGAISANGGREILNFGGIFYDFPDQKFRSTRFSTIRSFDVCEKKWSAVGDLGVNIFALQTSASNELQVSIICGGEARHPTFKGTMNSPWCLVKRFGPNINVQNRHGIPATSNFPEGFFPGGRGEIALSTS